MCRDLYSFSPTRAAHVLDLCLEMSQGEHDGDTLGYPGEPAPAPKKGGDAPGEPLEAEDFIGTTGGPARLAREVVEMLDEADAGELLEELNPGGRMRLPELLRACGVADLDLWTVRQQDEIAQALAGRDVRYLPCYFEPLLLRYGLQMAWWNLVDPRALAAAHEPAEEPWQR